MFYKGKPTIVTIDVKLPFIKPNFTERLFGKIPSLIYAKSAKDDNFYLASLFEKAVVKLVCNSFYSNSVGILPHYVFSSLSDCMVGCCYWRETDSKQNVIDRLKCEVDNDSSVVLNIWPDLLYKPECIDKFGHVFVVMDYSLEHNAIKLYDQRLPPIHYFTDFETNLPLSIVEKADPKKGEHWITLDQLKNRRVVIESLRSKNTYKCVFKVHKTLKQISYDRDYSKVKFACKVFDIEQASTFMINIFLFSHIAEELILNVYTADNEKQNVKFNGEVSRPLLHYENRVHGQAKSFYIQSFKLQPNKYTFQFEAKFKKTNYKNVDIMLKIGSASDCSFKEIVEESKSWWQCTKKIYLQPLTFFYISTMVVKFIAVMFASLLAHE